MSNINKLRIVSIIYKCRAYRKNNDIIHEVTCCIIYYNPILQTKVHSIGIARCDPNDVYYLNIGKHIAESRAKANMYRNYKSFLIDFRNYINNAIMKHLRLIHKEEYHIGDLIHGHKGK